MFTVVFSSVRLETSPEEILLYLRPCSCRFGTSPSPSVPRPTGCGIQLSRTYWLSFVVVSDKHNLLGIPCLVHQIRGTPESHPSATFRSRPLSKRFLVPFTLFKHIGTNGGRPNGTGTGVEVHRSNRLQGWVSVKCCFVGKSGYCRGWRSNGRSNRRFPT